MLENDSMRHLVADLDINAKSMESILKVKVGSRSIEYATFGENARYSE